MNSESHYTYSESKGGASLHWTIRVDAAGSRIEWCTLSDSQGWVCRLGSVHNDGVSFGSRIVHNQAEEKALLDALRLAAFGAPEAPDSHESLPKVRAA